MRAQLAQGLRLPIERGIHLGLDNVRGVGSIAARDPELLRARRDRGAEDGGRGRGAAQRVHLLQRVLDEKVRRDDLQSRIVTHPLGLLIQHPRKVAQPLQIGIRVLLIRDVVLSVQKSGHGLIGAGELAHHVGPPEIPVVEGLHERAGFQLERDGVVIGKVFAAE